MVTKSNDSKLKLQTTKQPEKKPNKDVLATEVMEAIEPIIGKENSLVLCLFDSKTKGYIPILGTPHDITQVMLMEKWIKENGDKLIDISGKIFIFRYLGSRKLLSKIVYSFDN